MTGLNVAQRCIRSYIAERAFASMLTKCPDCAARRGAPRQVWVHNAKHRLGLREDITSTPTEFRNGQSCGRTRWWISNKSTHGVLLRKRDYTYRGQLQTVIHMRVSNICESAVMMLTESDNHTQQMRYHRIPRVRLFMKQFVDGEM